MNWSSVSEFLSMGGYGFYVWGSYAMTLICIVGEILLISKRRRTLEKQYGQSRKLDHKREINETTS